MLQSKPNLTSRKEEMVRCRKKMETKMLLVKRKIKKNRRLTKRNPKRKHNKVIFTFLKTKLSVVDTSTQLKMLVRKRSSLISGILLMLKTIFPFTVIASMLLMIGVPIKKTNQGHLNTKVELFR